MGGTFRCPPSLPRIGPPLWASPSIVADHPVELHQSVVQRLELCQSDRWCVDMPRSAFYVGVCFYVSLCRKRCERRCHRGVLGLIHPSFDVFNIDKAQKPHQHEPKIFAVFKAVGSLNKFRPAVVAVSGYFQMTHRTSQHDVIHRLFDPTAEFEDREFREEQGVPLRGRLLIASIDGFEIAGDVTSPDHFISRQKCWSLY